MGVIIKIAFRNLKEHKAKTLIIGMIVTIGIFVLVIGNSFIDTATAGIRKVYIDNFTGDLIISGDIKGGLTLFGNSDLSRITDPVPRIPEYFKITEQLAALPEIAVWSPQIAGMATAQFGDKGTGFMQLFGVEIGQYRKTFPDNIEITAGAWLKPGEAGLLLSEMGARMIERTAEQPVKPGDKLLLSGIGGTGGTNIRELEIKGIFHFKHSNVQLNMVSIIDTANLRSLAGMTLGAGSATALTTTQQTLLENMDDEDLFGSGTVDQMISTVEVTGTQRSEASLLTVLGDVSERERLSQVDTGAWHFIIIKLKSAAQAGPVTAKLNRFFRGNGIQARVSTWREGAGMIAEVAYISKLVFNVIILVIAVVAILIIMNTIVISVLERIPEIGTMRALGAQKGFVRSLVTTETVIISGLFGLAGLTLGALVILVFNITGITASNMIFETLFGGKVLKPLLSGSSVVISLLIALGAGLAASLYPVALALKIRPVKAIQAE